MIKSFFGDPRDKSRETKRQHYAEVEGGIKINPVPITAGDKVNVLYDGVLTVSGADKVYLHAGFGHPLDWREVIDQPMVRTVDGWEATVRMENASRFNFCFKDSAGNWDNNYGENWSYEIHYGGL